MPSELFQCRVCGWPDPDPPWGNDGATPSFNFCDCCGVEFGYGDATRIAVQRYRAGWLAAGGKWHRAGTEPAGWNTQEQIARVPEQWR
jgi:hypothetical protein